MATRKTRVIRFWPGIRAFFLCYAVVFSIVGTIALIPVWFLFAKPVLQVGMLKYSNPGKTAFMKEYERTLKEQGADTIEITQEFVPLDSISKRLQDAVLAAEDDGFYTHPGFDVKAMLAALEYNEAHGRNKRGASTITQQLAKNLFLNRERSFSRKFRELGYTILMETLLGKKRILELYLNYAQWGKDVFGCEAASQKYYHKPSFTLNATEAARMAAVLARPAKLSPLSSGSVLMQKRLGVIANNLYLRHHPVPAPPLEEDEADSTADSTSTSLPGAVLGFFGDILSRDSSAITDVNSTPAE